MTSAKCMENMKCSGSIKKGGVVMSGRFRENFVDLGFETSVDITSRWAERHSWWNSQ